MVQWQYRQFDGKKRSDFSLKKKVCQTDKKSKQSLLKLVQYRLHNNDNQKC